MTKSILSQITFTPDAYLMNEIDWLRMRGSGKLFVERHAHPTAAVGLLIPLISCLHCGRYRSHPVQIPLLLLFRLHVVLEVVQEADGENLAELGCVILIIIV